MMEDSPSLFYRGRRVAVTGAQGYVGSGLVNALVALGANVVGTTRQSGSQFDGIELWTGDITDDSLWASLVERSEIIFHLAGNTSVYSAADDPAGSVASTVAPIILLAEAARKVNRHPKVVFASTVTVYGLIDRFPVSELVLPKPVNYYDLHKYFAEQHLELATRRGDLAGSSLRLANVYGPSRGSQSSADRGVINKVAASALAGEDLKVYGSGGYLRDYVYIEDVLTAFLLAGAYSEVEYRTFNVATGTGFTLSEAFSLIAQRACVHTGKLVQLMFTPWPGGADVTEKRNFVGDSTAAAEALGWCPRTSFQDGLDKLLAELVTVSNRRDLVEACG